jgi:hypothetical protein
MPRNLTDLFEDAVRTAPPEPHLAPDITRRAERSQRRRTTLVAGAVALTVVAVAGGGYGLTRGGHDSTPQPAAPYRYGEELDVKDAVAATSLPGFRVLPWTQPSLQHLGNGSVTLPTYAGIDASGRLIVKTYRYGGIVELRTVRLYDAPGQPAAPLRPPASSGTNSASRWIPSFTGDARLLWSPTSLQGAPQGVNTLHVTDLSGGQDVSITAGSVNGGVRAWVTGDRVLYEGQQSVTSQGTEIRRLYTEPLSPGSPARLVAHDVVAADVSAGVTAWVTTDARVHVANADGSGAREVPVPLDPGCTVTPAPFMSQTQALAVTRDVVALTERCGTGAHGFDELLAFDTSGRRLVHVKGISVTAVSLSGPSLAVGGLTGRQRIENLVYDLRTGTLASLGRFRGPRLYDGSPTVAGPYVLWYDRSGHVGEFTQ